MLSHINIPRSQSISQNCRNIAVVAEMLLVGLTGGIASGKSTVSSILRNEFNSPVVDADRIAREVVEPGKKAHKKIVQAFGEEILQEDGSIDRGKLGEIIFNNDSERRKLNSITHPEIGKAILWAILKNFFAGHRFVILDVPLLYESKTWIKFTNMNVVVYSDSETQLSRLMTRNNLSKEEAESRINSQMLLEEKKKLATVVIDNNGSLEETYQQVQMLYKMLNSSKKYLFIRGIFLATIGTLLGAIFYLFH